ncbi:MAG TPA: hypothetical protein VFI59_03980 [Actinomycetota bacterium]|nr:hypothetical protein [Actinomycetota bacterium]
MGIDGARRVAIAIAVAVVAFAAGTLVGNEPETPATETVASPSSTRTATGPDARLVIPLEMEPYDYRNAPPREATPVDGFYMRIFTIEEMGGPELGMPYHCLRCVPYSVDAGVQTLLLHQGRFYLEHQLNEFRALGHYVVDGDRIAFFNDVNCSQTRGEYTWNLEHRRLSFEVIDDPCPFVDERSHDLTLEPWSRIDVCYTGIKDWYPVRVGCKGV